MSRIRSVLPAVWILVVILIASAADWNRDARVLVVVAVVMSVGAALGSMAATKVNRPRLAGCLLIVSALVAPTTAIYPVNLCVALLGLVEAIRAPKADPLTE